MRDFENPMRYPVTLTPAVEGGFVVSFPDIPEALTQGNTRHDAFAGRAGGIDYRF